MPSPIDFYRPKPDSQQDHYLIKVTANNQTQQYKIPIFGNAPFDTSEDLLATCRTFNRVAERLNWDDPTCISHFENCLSPVVASRWQADANMAPAGATFTDVQHTFIQDFIPAPDAFLQLQNEIRGVKKSRNMTVQDFFQRIEYICYLAEALPQANGIDLLDDQGKLQTAFYGCPKAWRQTFEIQQHSLLTQTYTSLRNFMMTMEKNTEPPKASKKESNGNNTQNSRRNNRQHTQRSNQRNNYNNRTNRNNNSNRGNSPSNNRDDQPCPFPGHQHHKWSECRTYNSNANTSNRGTNNNNRSTGNSGNRNSSRDNNTRSSNFQQQTQHNESGSANADETHRESHMVEFTNSSYAVSDLFQYSLLHDEEVGYESDDTIIPELVPLPVEDEPPHDSYQQQLSEASENSAKVPSTLVSVTKIGGAKQPKAMVALLDSGGSHCLINRRCIPKAAIETTEAKSTFDTAAGKLHSVSSITIDKLVLPEFSRHLFFKEHKVYIFEAPLEYDMILGRDLLSMAGIDIKFSSRSIAWNEFEIPMKPPGYWTPKIIQDALLIEPRTIREIYSTVIKQSEYKAADLTQVIKEQSHLDSHQREQLHDTLLKHQALFDGKLKVYPHKEFSLKLKPNARPFHAKAYQVPRVHYPVFKRELQNLIEQGVLRPAGATEWAAGTFIIPKKDQTVRWVSDFRKLNQWIERKQYPLPKIQHVVQHQKPYNFITTLDVAMQYYTFKLDKPSQELCTIVTPFGKYHYNVLPMGVCQSPDWAQATMEDVLREVLQTGDVVCYIDDIKITSVTWEAHINLIQKVLTLLQENNFTINPHKCKWAVKEATFLGYLFTPTGVKPWPKRIDAIKALAPPTNRTEVRALCGAITFYRDMFPRRAEILAPITALMSKDVPFEWTEKCQQAFDTIRSLIAQEVLLTYPDLNLPFDIFVDYSDYQLGAIIKQQSKPIAF